jgi:hypothetical protein
VENWALASIVACSRDGSSMRGTVGREPKARLMNIEKIEIFSRCGHAFAADFVFEGRSTGILHRVVESTCRAKSPTDMSATSKNEELCA